MTSIFNLFNEIKNTDFIHLGTQTSRDDILNNIYNRPLSVRNSDDNHPSNVLWTSPCNPKTGQTYWQEWCQENNYHPQHQIQHEETIWHIVPKKDCKILVIKTEEDLLKLDKYRFPSNITNHYECTINYEALAKDYDAFYITNEGLHESQIDYSSKYFNDFCGWDCATCIFFHPNAYMMMTQEEYQQYKNKNITPSYLTHVQIPPQKFEKSTEPLILSSPTSDYRNITPNPKYISTKHDIFIPHQQLEAHIKSKGKHHYTTWKKQLLQELENACPYDPTLETKELLCAYNKENAQIKKNLTKPTQSFLHQKRYYLGRLLIKTLTKKFNKQKDTFSIPPVFFNFSLKSNPDILKVLIKFGLNPQTYFKQIKTVEDAKLLLDMGAKLDQKDDYDNYPIHYAKSVKLLQFYIENGAAIHPKDTFSQEQYQYLASINIDPNQYNWLHNTDENTINNLIEPFLQYKANPDIPDNKGETPLMKHLKSKFLSSRYFIKNPQKHKHIITLLRYGANPNAKDKQGKTPLMHTVDAESIKILLAYGADPLAKDKKGKSVLEYVSEHIIGIEEGINLIKKAIIQKNKDTFYLPTPKKEQKPQTTLQKILKKLFNER